jgi:TPR repeat protein
MQWMKKSADSKYQKALAALGSPAKLEEFKKIVAMAKAEKQKEKNSGLQSAVNSHFSSMKKLMGVNGKEVLAQLNDEIMPQSTKGFLHHKIDKKYYLPVWTFDKKAADEYVDAHLIANRDGSASWMSEEFFQAPLAANLLFPNPTIRAINFSYQDHLEKFFTDKKFKSLPQGEVMKIVKSIDADNWREDADNSIWHLGENYYFYVLADYQGRWQLRSYSLLKRQNDVYQVLGTFDTPPDAHQIAALLGALDKDPASLNNLAVDMETGAIDSVFSQSEEAELIFKMLADQEYATAALNLATFYRNRDNKEEADKYMKRAEELLKKTPATAK